MTNLVSRLLFDLTSDKPGISVIYKALNELVNENSLNDAVLVVDEPGIGLSLIHISEPTRPY